MTSGVVTRGTSKSAASRHIVAKTRARLREFTSQRLDDLSLVALFLDGITVAEHSVVVALGLTSDGTKVPLGLWQGSTENSILCLALLGKIHKRRNLLDHLPEHRRTYVGRALTEAYQAASADIARKRRKQLASWLEANGEEGASASLPALDQMQ